MQKPTAALLISTYNWAEALSLVLKSVFMQTTLPNEIVIAEDGTDERTETVIKIFADKFDIKHVRHEDKGFRKSLILNKAVKEIQSDYIIQIDGDIILHPKFIEDHISSAKTNYFVQGSRAMIKEAKSAEILQTENIDFTFLSDGLYSRFNAIRLPQVAPIFKLDPSNPFHLKGCNFAFWKSDFIRINGYYNGFEGWGFEDYEFGARLLHAGIKRRRLKMKAITYHIFHPYYSRSNYGLNDVIYQETIDQKKVYRSNGYGETD